MNRRELVMCCNIFQSFNHLWNIPFLIGSSLIRINRINQANIRMRILFYNLSDHSFHSVRITTIYSKFNKNKIRFVLQYLFPNPESTQIRTRTGHSGINPFKTGIRKSIFHVSGSLQTIAVISLRYATTNKSNRNFLLFLYF